MVSIIDFLEARVAEDEQRAGDPYERPHWPDCDYDYLGDGPGTCGCALPPRVLAECAAKRAIIAICSESGRYDYEMDSTERHIVEALAPALCGPSRL